MGWSPFDMHIWVTGPAIVVAFVLLALAGLRVAHRFVLPHLRIEHEDSEFSGGMLQSIMVFYGLALALIAVNVWQSYDDVAKITSGEATAFAVLYRDVSGYPEPTRSRLQDELRGYFHQIIHEAWPLQRKGQVPTAGVHWMSEFQRVLLAFEPATDGQRILHAETLRAYNHATEARRMRVDSVDNGLPGIMWVVILVGSVISMASCWFFYVEDRRLHAILVGLLAALISMVIVMTMALDRPFRGDLGLSPGPYELIYNQIMNEDKGPPPK
jgi:hypothetical protein